MEHKILRKQIIRELAMIGTASAFYFKRINSVMYLIEVIALAEKECEFAFYRVYQESRSYPELKLEFSKTSRYALAMSKQLGVKKPKLDDLTVHAVSPYRLRMLTKVAREKAYLVGCDIKGSIDAPINEVESALVVFNWRKAA